MRSRIQYQHGICEGLYIILVTVYSKLDQGYISTEEIQRILKPFQDL